jgi:citrate synthase
MSNSTSSIGEMRDGLYLLRGSYVSDLIKQGDFVSTLWLTWTGQRPSASIQSLIDACLVACIDHGTESPSAKASRAASAAGKSLSTSIAEGLQTLGPKHGNAAGPAARWISEAVANGVSPEEVIADFAEHGQPVPGIGHRIYSVDPRTEALFGIARDIVPSSKHLDCALAVARTLSQQKGKTMPVNVDGARGAIGASLGVEPEFADALFIVARTVGLAAQAREAREAGA